MPIYEYQCLKCRKRSTVLTLRVSEKVDPVCEHCGSKEMKRLISRVRVVRSEESRMERMADPSSLAGLDEKDPRSMVQWMKKMGQEMGDDMGEDYEQMVEEAEVEAEKEAKGEVEKSEEGGTADSSPTGDSSGDE
ncbi:MAG: zinc ribbon domain-containing protein [Nitrospirae bacterium]|nr:zinc ribbon domain-containing protein [Nitrospirota bacterium]